jgi:hypothetical protein
MFALGCDDDGPVGNTGSIEVTVSPAELSVPQGGSGAVTASLTRGGGFDGVVTLAIAGLPAGVSTTITPTELSGALADATVDVTVATTVATGTYTATITATAQGADDAITTYQLIVTEEEPPVGGAVEYRFCSESALPAFFAFQDGDGAWQAVTGSTSGGTTTFAFDLTQGHGGVLAVYQTAAAAVAGGRGANVRQMGTRALAPRDGLRAGRTRPPLRSSFVDAYQTEVYYASTAELVQDGLDYCAQTQPTKTITGSVAGVGAGAYGIVSLGGTTEIFDGAASTNPVTFTEVPPGPVDLVGTRTTPGDPPDRAIVFRGLDVPDGGSLPSVIDFDGPASSFPATATATITGGAGDDLEIFTELVTANTRAALWFDLAPSPTSTRPWAGLGPAAMVSGDFHGLVVFATPDGSADFRVSLRYVGPVTNQSLALGPAISAPTTSQVVGGAYPRFRFQGTLPAEYHKGASIEVLSSEEAGNVFSIIASSAWLAAAGDALAYDFTMPDVSGLAGFPAAARLTAGTSDAIASGFGFTGPGIFDLLPSLGSEFKAATGTATIDVP